MSRGIGLRQKSVAMALAALLLSSCTTTDSSLEYLTPSEADPAQVSSVSYAHKSSSTPPGILEKPVSRPANGDTLTLEKAVQIAVNWHPSIDEAVGKINQNTAEIGVARAGYYPKIKGGIGSSYSSEYSGEWQPRLNVSASQMVYDFGKVSGSVDARTAATNVSRAQLLMGVDILIRETANAVIEIQRYRALLAVAREQHRGVKAIASLVGERSDQGASTKSDQVQAEARVIAAESTILEISGQLKRWESTLADLLGRPGAIKVASNVPQWLQNTCSAAEPDWTKAPGVLQAQARKEEALAKLKVARAEVFPTLSLDASSGYDFNQGSSRNRSSEDPSFKVGLNISGNLYNGGATIANRNAANHALTASEAAIRNSRLEISSSLAQARSQTSSIQQLLGSLKTRSNMMSQTRDLYRQQYVELGTRTLLDLLNAEQELHQAAFDAANSTHDLRKLGVDCMFNSGRSRELFALEDMKVRGMELRL
ncbi:TolC family outer membrane protein [Brucella gallinifaecis]|uniref:TolC family outer membrane protein n=1 Tax=Brucella gallinifaecis TaxID=215590 RepID=UPI00236270A8|nr:TolC family outer membrane protein [Brucella gallinifaecis]